MLNVTDIVVGAKLSNNDKRWKGQVVEIKAIIRKGAAIDQNWAVYQGGSRKVKVRFDRIFLDGAAHTQGFNLVAPAAQQTAA